MSGGPDMTVLLITLEALVPLRIWEMRTWEPQRRIEVAQARWGEVLAGGKGFSGGADLMFGGRAAGRECAALITALAAMAYQPGGITFAGLHFDAPQCETGAALGRPTPPVQRRPARTSSTRARMRGSYSMVNSTIAATS